MKYLLFTLSATIGAMGDLAGHERRGSYHWPGRSAITGLLGAAMGIQRNGDFSGLDTLSMAIVPFEHRSHEDAFRDYHTFQSIPRTKSQSLNSRPQALREAGNDAVTSITFRDYKTGPLFGVAIWNGDLERIKTALQTPVFPLYFGRKSCPLSAPLGPILVEANDLDEALRNLRIPSWRSGVKAYRIITDAEPSDTWIETRYDQAIDRKRWHFSRRKVAIRQFEFTPEVQA